MGQAPPQACGPQWPHASQLRITTRDLAFSVNHGVVSPTLDVNPHLFVIPCNFGGDYRFTLLQLLSLTKCFFIQVSIIHDNIS